MRKRAVSTFALDSAQHLKSVVCARKTEVKSRVIREQVRLVNLSSASAFSQIKQVEAALLVYNSIACGIISSRLVARLATAHSILGQATINHSSDHPVLGICNTFMTTHEAWETWDRS